MEEHIGDPFPVAGEINFEADYRIRVHVRSPQPGYLYIFNEGRQTHPRHLSSLCFPFADCKQKLASFNCRTGGSDSGKDLVTVR